MNARNRSIRVKIFLLLLLPLLILSAMWGFVLNLTVGDGIALSRAKTLYESIGVTSTDLGLQLQAERALTAALLSTGQTSSTALSAQQAKSSAALDKFVKTARDEDIRRSTTPEFQAALDTVLESLDRLSFIREAVRTGRFNRLQAIDGYNGLMDELFGLYERMVSVPDLAIFQQASALQGMGNGYEMIAREDALIRGALVSGRLTQEEQNAFSEWVSTRRFLYRKNRRVLVGAMREPYEQVLGSPLFAQFAELENLVVNQVRSGGPLPAEADKWADTVDKVTARLDSARAKAAETLTAESSSTAIGIIARIVIAGGLGLVSIVITIIFSVRFGRRLARDLAGLRDAALDLANARLPRVVEKLRKGEDVDIEAEAPPIKAGGSSEVEDVARAFSSVQRTAVEAAVGQANLRKGVNQVFLNLARRNQSLLHRQLKLLDSMQSRTEEPESLEDLFRLDHLTTRMRRHAESLIILSGAAPGRAWRKPVPLVDVVRAAVAEVEDYTRISVMPMPKATLVGSAVADIVHLIAELLENATMFSPPRTKVQVHGEVVANGVALEIEDRGLGLSPEEFEAINKRLADPPEFDLTDSDRLGLFVVGQLAKRYGIKVVLRGSPFGGTTAIVLIPSALVADDGSPTPITGSRLAESRGAPTQDSDSGDLSTSNGSRLARRARPVLTPVNGSSAVDADKSSSAARDEQSPVNGAASQQGAVESAPTSRPSAGSLPRRGGLTSTIGPQRTAASEPTGTTSPADGSAGANDSGGALGGAYGGGPIRTSIVQGTHAGLPRRVRQASLAPQLRAKPPLSAPTPAASTEERSPEEARAMFAAIQRGSQRGREESERSGDGTPGTYAHKMHGEKGDA